MVSWYRTPCYKGVPRHRIIRRRCPPVWVLVAHQERNPVAASNRMHDPPPQVPVNKEEPYETRYR